MYSCGRKDNFPEAGRKADVIDVAEGRSPVSDRASEQDTTGGLERGMCLKGQLGNLREPAVSMHISGRTPGEQSSRRRCGAFAYRRTKTESRRGIAGPAASEALRDGRLAVLADHITEDPESIWGW
jgi:hypothetical protein